MVNDATESDTIAAYMLLEHALGDAPLKPHVVMETLDAGSAALLEARSVEVVNSPVLVADMLAATVTHPALLPVFDHMFQGTLGVVRTIALESLVGENREVDLFALDAEMRRQGMVLLGYQSAGPDMGVTIAPDKRKTLVVRRGDRVIVFERAK